MKKLLFLAFLISFSVADMKATTADTLVFDLGQAVITSSSGISYIEFPVIIHSTDPTINAVDWWFQFDLTKLTYVSTTSLVTGFDVFSNFNSNNLYLSNSSSTTSIADFLQTGISIMKVKFQLASPCTEIVQTDFYNVNTLLNGVVSSYLFLSPQTGTANDIQVFTPNPLCAENPIQFSFGATYNGLAITAYNWDFGNGTTATTQTASATFANAGPQNIQLNVTTAGGCTYTITKVVTISPLPIVSFTSNYNVATHLMGFQNTSTISSGSLGSYDWHFGDGSTSSLENPSHGYGSFGTYYVTFTARSVVGCSDSVTAPVIVPLSVTELQMQLNFRLYPTLADEFITLSADQVVTCVITDISGQEVSLPFQLTPFQTRNFNVAQLASGVYVLRYGNSLAQFGQRFVVAHNQ
jgi:PKD repeat protein